MFLGSAVSLVLACCASGIVGAREAFPAVVSIQIDPWPNSRHVCSGTLIGPDVVLSAAHCFYRVLWPQFHHMAIIQGAPDLQRMPGRAQRVRVRSIAVHPQWDRDAFHYDVCILRLYSAVESAPNFAVLPPASPHSALDAPGKRCRVVGWGSTDPESPAKVTPVRGVGHVRMIASPVCRSARPAFEDIGLSQVCGVSGNASTSLCAGDSGAPLFCPDDDGRLLQTGVTSFGARPCSEAGGPFAFARLSLVSDWIRSYL